jgi:hypothetical protein
MHFILSKKNSKQWLEFFLLEQKLQDFSTSNNRKEDGIHVFFVKLTTKLSCITPGLAEI